MYNLILLVHSYWRWIALISIFVIVINSLYAYHNKKAYQKVDNLIMKLTLSIFHFQLIVGVLLYSFSPFVTAFYVNPSKGLHLRDIRFFAIEHALMMIVSIIIMTVGSVKVKKKHNQIQKHKLTYIWFGVALIIIILNIPWEFCH